MEKFWFYMCISAPFSTYAQNLGELLLANASGDDIRCSAYLYKNLASGAEQLADSQGFTTIAPNSAVTLNSHEIGYKEFSHLTIICRKASEYLSTSFISGTLKKDNPFWGIDPGAFNFTSRPAANTHSMVSILGVGEPCAGIKVHYSWINPIQGFRSSEHEVILNDSLF